MGRHCRPGFMLQLGRYVASGGMEVESTAARALKGRVLNKKARAVLLVLFANDLENCLILLPVSTIRLSEAAAVARKYSLRASDALHFEEQDAYETLPCSAGHTACYVSPYGDVYPCVQFPLPSGNVRQQKFIDIWRDSPQLQEVRSISMADLQGCGQCVHSGTCSRCPGLAYMEGNMRGPSSADCEKSFARTGIPSAGMLQNFVPRSVLVQIQGF